MKKYQAYSLWILLIMFSGFVAFDNGNENAVKTFNETFKDVNNLKWFDTADYSLVYFEKNNIRSKITYDKEGKFVSSVRYYDEDHLPLNVLLAVKEKYKGKTIVSINEVFEEHDISYYVTVEDDKFFYTIKSTATANLSRLEKIKKQ